MELHIQIFCVKSQSQQDVILLLYRSIKVLSVAKGNLNKNEKNKIETTTAYNFWDHYEQNSKSPFGPHFIFSKNFSYFTKLTIHAVQCHRSGIFSFIQIAFGYAVGMMQQKWYFVTKIVLVIEKNF